VARQVDGQRLVPVAKARQDQPPEAVVVGETVDEDDGWARATALDEEVGRAAANEAAAHAG
jgi:hypothetical protein